MSLAIGDGGECSMSLENGGSCRTVKVPTNGDGGECPLSARAKWGRR